MMTATHSEAIADIARKPDVVFIEFSINDAYPAYKITVEDSKKCLNAIIGRILEAHPKTGIILQTMNPVTDIHSYDYPYLKAAGAKTILPPTGNPQPAEMCGTMGGFHRCREFMFARLRPGKPRVCWACATG